jgi:hypothetical protein
MPHPTPARINYFSQIQRILSDEAHENQVDKLPQKFC